VGPSVRLRPWTVDEAAWYVAARDAEVFRWTTESRTVSVAAVQDAIRRNTGQPQWVGLAITDAGSGELLGNIALVPTADRPTMGEVSYWLAPQGRGRGAATEAVQLLVAWACASGAFTSLVLYTLPGNAASQAVALRAGFHQAAVAETRVRFALACPPTDGCT
jgi:RimJ/RimL family protein N-acetyltransferase